MEKFKFIIGVIFVGTFVSVNSLQCYQCKDCSAGLLTDTMLVTCGEPEPTSSVAPSTSSTPTSSMPVEPTPTVTTSPAPVEPTPTATTTSAPVNPTTTTTSAPVNPTPSTTTSSPVNPTPSTTTSAPVDPNPTAVPTSAPVDPVATRVRRYAMPELANFESGCMCNGEICSCDSEEEVLRSMAKADNITYVCAKVTMKVNGTDVTSRGCTEPKLGDKNFCDFLQQTENITSCITCDTDKCNSAVTMQNSILVLLFVSIMTFFTK